MLSFQGKGALQPLSHGCCLCWLINNFSKLLRAKQKTSLSKLIGDMINKLWCNIEVSLPDFFREVEVVAVHRLLYPQIKIYKTLFGLTEYLTVPTCNFVSTNANNRLKQALLKKHKRADNYFPSQRLRNLFFSNKLNPNIYMHKFKKKILMM